jgi:hypothetical protein
MTKDLDKKIIELMDLFDDEQVTTADQIKRPEKALEKEAIDDFMKRNPMAGGGMLVQPGFGGVRQGYSGKRGPKSKNPYLKDKKFLKYAEENFGYTPDMGARGVEGGSNLAGILEQYEKSLAAKNKIIGVQSLIDALGENNPYSRDSITKAFSLADKKITKNMSVEEKSKIKMGKKIKRIIVGVLGEPTTLGELYEPYKYIRKEKITGNTKVFELNKTQINKINKLLSKDYAIQGMQQQTIDGIYDLFDDKKFLKEVKKYDGKAVDINSYLFKKVFEPGKGGKNAYAYMQLGRALRGEIQLDGINVDKKLGNKIIQSISHNSATNIDGEMGKAASRWAKFQMAKFFDDPNVTYRTLSESIINSFKNIGGKQFKNIDLDEIFPARTGQITYAKGSGVYNQFIQAIDSKINQKSKRSFDGRMSARLQALDPAYKLAQKTGDYSKVKSIIEAHDLDIENFYKTNPEAKGKVNLTKFRFDDKTKKFLSPEQVFESQYKGAYETIPSKIREGMEKFYSKTGISIDPGTAVTLEKAATELKGDKKQQSEILRKMGFKCKYAKADGGRIHLKKGTLGKCDDPANYVEDINKTRSDLNSNDVTVRAAAKAKLDNSLKIAKTLPTIGTFLRRVGQATVGGVTSTLKALGLTTPVGYAIEGMVEGGVYDYFRKQGYTHDQAYAETFTPGLITGRPEGVPWYGGAESLLEKELLGSGFQQNPKVLQYQKALEDQQQIYDAFADKQRGIKAQRKDITDTASADIQDAYRSGMVSRVNQIMNPESMASRAYQTALETQAGKQDQRARDYMAENYVQTEPSEFMQNKLQEERNKAMLELFPPPTVNQIREAYTAAGYKDFLPLLKAEDYKKEMKAADDYQKQSYFADNFRLEKAGGGRAGFKIGSTRKGILKLIDESVKSTPKDITPDLTELIKKTLDEDFFDKKDRIVDTLNVKAARERKNFSYNQKVQEEPDQLEFYDDITKSNFRTKTGPFFDYQKRKNKAGGGILKEAGDSSGPPPESGPMSEGLQGLMKRGIKT